MRPPKDEKPLNAQQVAFVAAVLADPERNATRAYASVYPKASHATAMANSSRLWGDLRVQAMVEEHDAEMRKGAKLSREMIAQHVRELVAADPRDLTEYYRGACRYCWGHKHRYHFTPAELERAIEAYRKDKRHADDPMALGFDYKGGVGFNPHAPAHPTCPECFGHGEGYSYVKDTRTLTPEAARLFAGVKQTKDGLQILTRSQDKMTELAMRYLGMMTERKDDNDDDPPPVAVTYAFEDGTTPATEAIRDE